MAKEPTGARDDDWYVRTDKEPKFEKTEPAFHTVNGCGTALFGKTYLNDGKGSYMATSWNCLFWVPLIPIQTFIVSNEKEGKDYIIRKTTSLNVVPTNLDTKKVIPTLLLNWGIIIPFFSFIIIFDPREETRGWITFVEIVFGSVFIGILANKLGKLVLKSKNKSRSH